ncbi:PREDICTED: probable protein phosphatase 2C 14 [Ipomoea nil]|uniref:probable protein phosphatase 2C 14 n=1 Tax=Ipomoea nil TaxID=35883 RepID=UPI0009019A91|nr:PREDICTED: probable protein phosphatase 2C 14 [Ipomoea nil]
MHKYKLDVVSAAKDVTKINKAIVVGFFFNAARKDSQKRRGLKIIVSNLGDCRAVLCGSGVAEVLTRDHRAGQEDERRRIKDKGGYVEIHKGAWRVHGVLSVSISIGDAHLKD